MNISNNLVSFAINKRIERGLVTKRDHRISNTDLLLLKPTPCGKVEPNSAFPLPVAQN